MPGLDLAEVGGDRWRQLWLRGGFPRSWLAEDDARSEEGRRDFVRSLARRDLPGLGISLPPVLLQDFWTMLAHYHGQSWNGSELARAFGLAHTTVRRYLDRMTGAYLVRLLRPWRRTSPSESSSRRRPTSPTAACCMCCSTLPAPAIWRGIPRWEQVGRDSPWSRLCVESGLEPKSAISGPCTAARNSISWSFADAADADTSSGERTRRRSCRPCSPLGRYSD